MKPKDIATYIWQAKANKHGIILAMLVIVIEEATECFAFDTSPAGQASLESP